MFSTTTLVLQTHWHFVSFFCFIVFVKLWKPKVSLSVTLAVAVNCCRDLNKIKNPSKFRSLRALIGIRRALQQTISWTLNAKSVRVKPGKCYFPYLIFANLEPNENTYKKNTQWTKINITLGRHYEFVKWFWPRSWMKSIKSDNFVWFKFCDRIKKKFVDFPELVIRNLTKNDKEISEYIVRLCSHACNVYII